MKYFLLIKDSEGETRVVPVSDIVDIPVQPGDDIIVMDENGEPVDVSLRPDEEDLVVDFKDGTKAILKDFYDVEEGSAPITISLNPIEPPAPEYEFNSQTGNLPSAKGFTLMRFSNTEYVQFVEQLDDLNAGTLLGVLGSLRNGGIGGSGGDGTGGAESTDEVPASDPAPTPTPTTPATVTATSLPNNAPTAVDDTAISGGSGPVAINVLGNDSDPDAGDVLIVTGVDQPAQGSVSINSSGQVVFDPGSDFSSLGAGESATVTFDYAISDSEGGTDTATVTVTVNGVDDPTETQADEAVTNENTAIVIDVLGNDSDPDTSDNPLTIASVTQPVNGTVTNNGTDVTFDPGAGFQSLAVGESATVTFTYTTDTGATEDVTVTVHGQNNAPVAIDDAAVTNQDTPIAIDALANDFDPDTSDDLIIQGVDQPALGSASVDSNNQIVFDPGDDFDSLGAGESATVTFDYFISDGSGTGGVDTATVTVTVNGVDDATETNPDVGVTDEDTPVTIDVLANDSDPDTSDNPLTIASVTSPALGVVTNNGTDVTFDPNGQFESLAVGESATVTFSYTTDTGVTENVTVTVNGVNDGPTANDDVATTDEDNPVVIDAAGNDTDPDGDDLTITGVDQPARGSVTIDSNNQLVFDPGDDFDDLDVGESATVTFDYSISDGNGGTDTATVTVTVDGADDATETAPDAAITDENTPVVIDVLSNDSDVDTSDNPLSLASVSLVTGGGSAAVTNAGADVTFDPGTDFDDLAVGESATATFTYTTDTGATEDVTVTVNGTNDAPDAVDDVATTDQDTPLAIDVLANDTDPDTSDTLILLGVNQPSLGQVQITGGNQVLFDPNDDFDDLGAGESATVTFDYAIYDGNGGTDTATVTVTVNGADDATVTSPDVGVTDEDTPVTIDVLANDSDVDASDNPLTIASVTPPALGVVTNNGTDVTFDPNGQFESLAVGESATVTFSYLTSTGVSENVTVTVNGVNDGPTANDDVATTDEDNPVVIDAAGNDTDPDGDDLEITGVDQPARGSVTIDSNNQLVFDPGDDFQDLGPGESATVTFDYSISDGNGGTDTATVTVTVDGADDATETAPDAAITDENTPVVIDVLSNDSDVDTSDNPLSVASVSLVTGGGSAAVTNAGADVTFNPGTDFDFLAVGESATATFTYTTDTGITENVTVTVNGTNDAPDAVDDAAMTDQDTPLTIDVLANDTDPDTSDALIIAGVDQPARGSVSINSDNEVVFDPGNDFDDLDVGESATVTFDYTISDGNGGTDTATVTVTVDGADDATETSPDAAITDENTPVVIDVLSNDSDVDTSDNPLSVASVSLVTGGGSAAVTNAGADVTFDPGTDFDFLAVGESATATFTYTTDTGATENVTVTVNGTNDAPDAIDDTALTDQDTPLAIDVLANDTDPDTSDALIISGVNQPGLGSVSVNADNQIVFDPGNDFDDLSAGESATVTFDYTISDGNGGSDTATVTVTVDGVNDATETAPDAAITDENTPVVIDVLSNDSDADTSDNPLSVASVSLVTGGGSAAVTNAGADVTFDPGTDFDFLAVGESATATFTYTTDTGETENVTVTVNGTNDAPAANDDFGSTDEDNPVVIDALANDTDPDTSDALVITGVDQPARGSVSVNSDNEIVFDPGDDFQELGAGESATVTFDYSISDGNGGTDTATVTVTVDGADDATETAPDFATTDEETPINIDVLSNDSDVDTSDNPLTIASVVPPALGLVTNNGTDVTFDPNGQFENLAVGESATVTFSYLTSTGVSENVTVTVNGVNDAPDAIDDADNTTQGAPVTIDVLGNDTDPDNDTLVVTGVTQPGQGTVTYNAGDVTFDPGSDFDYLDAGESATVTFSYDISDGNGGTDTATVTVTVDGADDATETAPDAAITDENTPVVIDVLANDSDVDTSDNPLSVASVSLVAGGGSAAVTNAGADVTFNPGTDFDFLAVGESATATFTYTTDTGVTENVTVTVNGTNDAPDAIDDAATTDQDTPLAIDVLANDTDPDTSDALIISGVDQPALGSVSINADNEIVFDPGNDFDDLDAGESATVTFDYTISDGNGGSDTATVTVTVDGVDDATETAPDVGVTDEDTPITIDVLANDSDSDTSDNPLTIASVVPPALGVVTNNGTDVTFDPNGQFESLAVGESATVTFSYLTSTGVSENVTVTVNGVNDGPTANDDVATTDEDSPVVIDAAGNDTDPDGDDLTITGVDQPARGSVTIDSNNQLVFDPGSDFDDLDVGESATVTFDYSISDGNGGTDTATVTVTVDGADDATETAPDAAITDENTPVVIDVLSNDSDVDTSDNPLSVASVSLVTGGGSAAVTNAGADVTFDPGTDFDYLAVGESATATFTYTTDTGVTENVTVTVNGTNDAPDAVDDSDSTDENSTVSIDALANDTDPDTSDALIITGVDQPARGSVSVNADNEIVFDPGDAFDELDDGESATVTFDYTISDGNGGTDTATVTVTVNGVDNATDTDPDFATTDEETPVNIDVLANDSDVDTSDNPLSIATVTQPALGVVTNNGTDVSFDPNGEFESLGVGESATVSFTYTTDTGVTESVTVTVNGVNDDPVAVADATSTGEDDPVVIDLLGAGDSVGPDTDVDGDALTLTEIEGNAVAPGSVVVLSSGARVTVLPNGQVSYDPDDVSFQALDDGESTTDTFSYVVDDGNGGSDTATVTVTVVGEDDVTMTVPDTGSTFEGTSVLLDVLANDSDVDTNDNPLSIASVTQPGAGLGTVTNNGTDLSFDPGTDFDYLAAGESATVSFTYTTQTGVTENVVVTVNGLNDGPTAVDDDDSTNQGTPVTIDVLTNDTDPDTNDVLAVMGVDQPGAGQGSVSIDASNRLVFDPGSDFDYLDSGESATVTFDYTVTDGNGGTDTATVTVTVNGADDATDTDPDNASTDEETAITIDVLANDTDVDTNDNPLTISTVTQPGKGSVTNNGNNLEFDPGTDFADLDAGESETVTFTYTTDTGVTENVTVTVNGITNLQANDDSATTDEDSAVVLDPMANDTIAPFITANITELDGQAVAPGGSVTLGSGATVTLQPGNTISYDPTGNFDHLQVGESATETFTYEVTGGIGLTATATETITIEGLNDGPTIDTIDITTVDGAPVQLDVTMLASTDPDHLDPADLTYNVDDVIGGYFALTSNTGSAITNFTQQQVNDGDITFVPTASEPEGATGGEIDIMTFDSSGDYTDHDNKYDDDYNTTVFNYFGFAEDDLVEPLEEFLSGNPSIDGDTKFKILIGNADLSPGLSISINENYDPSDPTTFVAGTEYDDTDLASLEVYSFNGVPGSTQLTSLVLAADRDVIVNAGLIATKRNEVEDNDPGKDGEYRSGAFTIQIVAVNDDGTDAFTTDTSISNGGVQGIAEAGNGMLWESTLFWDSDLGEYDAGSPYVPGDPSTVYAGLEDDDGVAFQLTVSDPPGLTDTDYGALAWDSAPPEADPDFYTVNQGDTVDTDPVDNDTDPNGDDLEVTHVDGILLPYEHPVTLANGATVELQRNGEIEYTSARIDLGAGQSATETFTYTVRDTKDATATETVTVTVIGADDPTVTAPDQDTTDENDPVTVDVLANDSDPDLNDNPLTIASVTQPGANMGTVTNNGSDLTFDPGTDFDYLGDGDSATVTFTYTTDTGVTENVTITINGENDAPDVQDDIVVSTTDIDPVTIDVLSNDSDIDGTIDPTTVDLDLTTTGVQDTLIVPNEGTWTVDSSGMVTFTPDPTIDDQPAPIQYSVADDDGATSIGTIDLKYSAADVWFGNDESGSVSSTEFNQSRTLISGAAAEMTFATGDLAFNAALFSWSGSSQQEVKIGITQDETTFVNDSANYSREYSNLTDIGAAIAFGRTQINNHVAAMQGSGDPRADVPQVLVILTDASEGQIDGDSTLAANAAAAKADGIILVFVAIQEAVDGADTLELHASLDANSDPLVVTADAYADIDSSEIADLLNAIREAAAAGLLPPVVIDLDGDGTEFDGVEEGIAFDADGDGVLEQVAWADEDDAVLVYDANNNDQVDGIDEVSFARYSEDRGATDLEGLRHFDTNEDMVLDANDAEFEAFKLWQDRDGDGTVDDGEMMTLTEAGIESIGLTSDGESYYTAGGDVRVHGEGTVKYADGSEGKFADAEFKYDELTDDTELHVVTENGDVMDVNDADVAPEPAGDDLLEGSGGESAPADANGMESGGAMPTTSGDDDAAAADAAMS